MRLRERLEALKNKSKPATQKAAQEAVEAVKKTKLEENLGAMVDAADRGEDPLDMKPEDTPVNPDPVVLNDESKEVVAKHKARLAAVEEKKAELGAGVSGKTLKQLQEEAKELGINTGGKTKAKLRDAIAAVAQGSTATHNLARLNYLANLKDKEAAPGITQKELETHMGKIIEGAVSFGGIGAEGTSSAPTPPTPPKEWNAEAFAYAVAMAQAACEIVTDPELKVIAFSKVLNKALCAGGNSHGY